MSLMTINADITGKQLQLQWCFARNSIKALEDAVKRDSIADVADIGGYIDNALTALSFAVKDSLDPKKRSPSGISLDTSPKQAKTFIKDGLRLHRAKKVALKTANSSLLVHTVGKMVSLANEVYSTAPKKWAPSNEVEKP